MKLILDKKHANRVVFLAKDITLAFANVVRRYGLSRIPVMAIEGVTFYDNTTAFWDEYIAHRLGLLPLTSPEIPSGVEVTFSLDAEGPKVVYASDLVSSDKDIAVAQPKIPIVTLGSNQRLRFECKAVVGTAMTHAKFQAGLISYGAENDNIIFTVESFYQMEPFEVISRTCDIVTDDIGKIEEALGKKVEKKAKATKAEKPKKEKKAKKEKAEKEDKKEE
jgi:DNA-directed RNA polymerase subunit D